MLLRVSLHHVVDISYTQTTFLISCPHGRVSRTMKEQRETRQEECWTTSVIDVRTRRCCMRADNERLFYHAVAASLFTSPDIAQLWRRRRLTDNRSSQLRGRRRRSRCVVRANASVALRGWSVMSCRQTSPLYCHVDLARSLSTCKCNVSRIGRPSADMRALTACL